MFWHHGGFHGAITKGVLSVKPIRRHCSDADIVVVPIHDRWCVEHPMYRLSQNGAYKVVPQLHIKVGNYKEEYTSGSGWAIEKIVFPKAIGGQWLNFSIENGDVRARATMT
ncbi:MAG: hypothetical protein IPJ00_20495 [Saprospirales bacterium]|nr:hypothetical protein [Saprospirales bacterium]